MIDFEKYKNPDKEYEQELREKPTDKLTQEEIEYLADKNESFRGTKLNKKAEARYYDLKQVAADFLSASEFANSLRSSDPEQDKPEATVYVRLSKFPLLYNNASVLFKKMVSLSDEFSLAVIDDGDEIQMGFTVQNIWS